MLPTSLTIISLCSLVLLQGCAMLGRDFQRVHIEKKCEVTLTRAGTKVGQPERKRDGRIVVGPDCTIDIDLQDQQTTPAPATQGTSDG